MSELNQAPVLERPRGLCPICGKTSYSRTGTHPQCAVARADQLTKAARKSIGTNAPKAPPRKSWSKPCPKCSRQVAARRFVCDCGHAFTAVRAAQTPTENRSRQGGKPA